MRLQVYGKFDIHQIAGYLVNWDDECKRRPMNHTGLDAVPAIVTRVDVAIYNDSVLSFRCKIT